jgi:hypothetical protein
MKFLIRLTAFGVLFFTLYLTDLSVPINTWTIWLRYMGCLSIFCGMLQVIRQSCDHKYKTDPFYFFWVALCSLYFLPFLR